MEGNNIERDCYADGSDVILHKGSGRRRDTDGEEDDGVTFVGSPSTTSNDEQHSNGHGLYLDTKLARRNVIREADEKDVEGCERQEAPVTVVFDLPDGSQADQEFQLGQTVEVLKSYVESEFGVPMTSQELYLGSTLMMDPMTLLDYPQVDGTGEVFIVVEGKMSEEAKK